MIEESNVMNKLPHIKEEYTRASIDMDKGTFYYYTPSNWHARIEIDIKFEENNIKDLIAKLEKIKWDNYDRMQSLLPEMLEDYCNDVSGEIKRFWTGTKVDTSTYERFEETVTDALYNDFLTYAGVLSAIQVASYPILQGITNDEEKIDKMDANDIISECGNVSYLCDENGDNLKLNYDPKDINDFYNKQCELFNINTSDIDQLDIPDTYNPVADLFNCKSLNEVKAKQDNNSVVSKNELKAERIANRMNSINEYCKSVYTRYIMKGKEFILSYMKDCEKQISYDKFIKMMENYLSIFNIKIPEYDNIYCRFQKIAWQ